MVSRRYLTRFFARAKLLYMDFREYSVCKGCLGELPNSDFRRKVWYRRVFCEALCRAEYGQKFGYHRGKELPVDRKRVFTKATRFLACGFCKRKPPEIVLEVEHITNAPNGYLFDSQDISQGGEACVIACIDCKNVLTAAGRMGII